MRPGRPSGERTSPLKAECPTGVNLEGQGGGRAQDGGGRGSWEVERGPRTWGRASIFSSVALGTIWKLPIAPWGLPDSNPLFPG